MSIWEYIHSDDYLKTVDKILSELRRKWFEGCAEFAGCSVEQAEKVIEFYLCFQRCSDADEKGEKI